MNLSIDWSKIWGSNFDGRFFITNLTDTVYRIGGGYLYSSFGTDQAIYNEPDGRRAEPLQFRRLTAGGKDGATRR